VNPHETGNYSGYNYEELLRTRSTSIFDSLQYSSIAFHVARYLEEGLVKQ